MASMSLRAALGAGALPDWVLGQSFGLAPSQVPRARFSGQ
jgi:hypothetical protein